MMTTRESVPLRTAALCADCSSIFDFATGYTDCPRCASGSWTPVQSGRAADEIERLRGQLEHAKGALMQIAWAKFTLGFKEGLAKRTLKQFSSSAQNETTAEAKSQKGTV